MVLLLMALLLIICCAVAIYVIKSAKQRRWFYCVTSAFIFIFEDITTSRRNGYPSFNGINDRLALVYA